MTAPAQPYQQTRWSLVSPFKNTCRSAEVILHQTYPITVECVARLALMELGGRDVTKAPQSPPWAPYRW